MLLDEILMMIYQLYSKQFKIVAGVTLSHASLIKQIVSNTDRCLGRFSQSILEPRIVVSNL
jgi:hypothetical protein